MAANWISFGKYLLFINLVFLPSLLVLSFFPDRYETPKWLAIGFIVSLLFIIFGISFLSQKIRTNRQFIRVLGLFFISFLISTILSINRLTSIFGFDNFFNHTLLQAIVVLGASFCFHLWLQKDRLFKLTSLAEYISLNILLISFMGIWQQINQTGFRFEVLRVRSTFGEPNRLSLYLTACLPFAVSLIFHSKKKLQVLGLSALLLSILTLILTYSRGAWLVLFITALGYCRYYYKKFIYNLYLRNRLIYIGLIVVALVIVGGITPIGKYSLNRLYTVKNDIALGRGSLILRLREWQESLSLFKDLPNHQKLFGIGPNAATYKLLPYKNSQFNSFLTPKERIWRVSYIRNQYLHILINQGIIGMVIYVLIIAMTLKQALKQKTEFIEKAYLASFIIIILSNIIYYQSQAVSLLFWLTIAVVFNNYNYQITPRLNRIFVNLILILGLGIFLFMSLFTISEISYYYNHYSLPTKLLPWVDKYWRSWANVSSYRFHQDRNPNDIDQAIKYATKAVQLNPLEVDNLAALQLAYYRKGVYNDKKYHTQALEIGLKRLKLDPSRPDSYDDLGLIYLDLNQLDKAHIYFTKAFKLDPKNPVYYQHIKLMLDMRP